MSYSPSIIERLQLDMGAIAQAAPYFANVPVNVLRPRANNSAVMIQDRINKALQGFVAQAGGTGATILIDMPEGEVPFPETPGPDLRLVCKVQVIENPLIDMGARGTMKSAEDLMLAVLNLYHMRFFQDSGSTMLADKDAFRPLLHYLEKNYVAYECRFLMKMGLSGPKKTPMPGITGNSTDGATITGPGSIYFTTDGSYPTPTNGQLLGGPILDSDGNPILDGAGYPILTSTSFPVASGTLVRAVAYQNNQQASDLAAKTIS